MKQLLVIVLLTLSACTKAQTGILGIVTTTGPVYSADTIYLSQQGIVSDAVITMNSATLGSDQTATIQSALDGADTTKIVMADVRASATQLALKSGLKLYIPSGYGFIQRDWASKPFIVNKNRTTGAIVDKDIRIFGPGILNFNGYRGGSPMQTKQTMEGWTTGIRFAGVKNVTVDGVRFLNARTFASLVSNFENVTYRNTYCENQSQDNQDGFKFLKGQTVRVENVSFKNLGDDCLSFVSNDIFWTTNAPNGPALVGGGQTAYDPYAVYGDIHGVVVDGVTIDNGRYGLRLLSGDASVYDVLIKNVGGNTSTCWLIMDNYSEAPGNLYGAGGIGSATNTGHFGIITFEDVNVSLNGTNGYKSAYAYIHGEDIMSVTFNRYTIPNANIQPYPAIKVDAGSVIGTMNVYMRYVPDPANGSTKVTNLGSITNYSYSNY